MIPSERKALKLCAPIIADDLQSFEECHAVPGDKTGASFDPAERAEHKKLKRVHAELVALGYLEKGRFKHRPKKVLR